jgi:hypothetical protein
MLRIFQAYPDRPPDLAFGQPRVVRASLRILPARPLPWLKSNCRRILF